MRRWDPCIAHTGADVDAFVRDYFGTADRKVLFVAGAGFDPRATAVGIRLAQAGASVRAFLIREERPNPAGDLIARASGNANRLSAAFGDHEEVVVSIFGSDNAIVGGRNAVMALHRQRLDDVNDVVIDVSAISVGTSFPLIRYLVERVEQGQGPANLHIFVAHEPTLDEAIHSIASDSPSFVHGFRGRWALEQTSAAAKLWLPQLARGRRAALVRLHDFVKPHDTCPILPFPANNPRLADALAEHFLTEFESTWSVDTRNIVYAAEDDPLDLYRTILSLDDLRKPVFKEFGGSMLVLSPLGSKVMALGALMAALERDLPVAYIEAIGYNLSASVPSESSSPHLVHVWLEGDAYPAPRPSLISEGIRA